MSITTTNVFSTERSEQAPPNNRAQARSEGIRSVLAVGLLALVYLLSTWTPGEADTSSLNIRQTVLMIWGAGGIVTLALLAFAARKNS